MLSTFGRYEALHLIASGGMASVYLGRTRGAGGFERLVALKVMHEHISHDATFSDMFLDEARLAARIRHPNVVPTLDVADDGRFIVMEYIEGASLHAIIKRLFQDGRSRLDMPAALRIFLDVLAGLHAAHELCDDQGQSLHIVHRDVSPHNILVGVDGTSRITDFGIAYAAARITSTRSGQLKGKLPYMAPEQLEDLPIDRRTDVYAAGCVLWEMLSGRRLYRGSNEAAVACAVLAGPERTLAQERAEVPAAISDACMTALRRRDERYETALQFAEAIEHAAEEAGIGVAKHRDVGPVTACTTLTFPAPRSVMTAPAASPPLTQDAASDPAVSPPSSSSATHVLDAPPTVRETPLQGPEAEAPPERPTSVTPEDVVPAHVRTTAEDRPPPEVAAVIRAAQAHLDSVERVSAADLDEAASGPDSGATLAAADAPTEGASAGASLGDSVARDDGDSLTTQGPLVPAVPTSRRGGRGAALLGVLLLAVAAAALWLGVRAPSGAGTTGVGGGRTTASASGSAIASTTPEPSTTDNAATASPGAATGGAPPSLPSTSSARPAAQPPTAAWPTSTMNRPQPTHTAPSSIPTPTARPSGYHPAAP